MLLALSVISAHGAGMGPTAYKIFDERGGSIGRLDTNDWSLPDPAKIVSSRHAQVNFASGGFYLQDMSTNGTFINSREQLIERDAGHWLADGDRVLIGDYEILVQIIDDGIPALDTGEPPREVHGSVAAREERQPQVERSLDDATDPMGLTRLRGETTGMPGADGHDAQAGGAPLTVPTDWQITRFRNLAPQAPAPAPQMPLVAAEPVDDEETSLSPEDAVSLLLALGIDPTGIELEPQLFAMLAGIRAGYQAMLRRVDPQLLGAVSAQSESGFRQLFGAAFEQAYQRALDELLLTEHKVR